MKTEFIAWYQKHHGYKPFPWQVRLAELIAAGTPPASIDVPTGSGKTAIIAVWQWAQESDIEVPTRLVYVVDRRLIVDSVTDYAKKLDCNVIKMRGGVTVDDSWMMDPHRPTVMVSTVDQVGSRLLWRGYGVSHKAAPIHAALVGNDAMIVLDEAHISTPFANTLARVNQLRGKSALPWYVITMTATPMQEGDGQALKLSKADLTHPVLRKRLDNIKEVRLLKVAQASFVKRMVSEAQGLRDGGAEVVGIICNTTGDARKVYSRLTGEKVLLTGRIRPADKDAILTEYLPRILSGSRSKRAPLYVVATQTIEVGADLDFDALVSQSAPVDALRQRFGRQDRLGEMGSSKAVIIHKTLGANDECLVYGRVFLNKTWAWLVKAQTGKGQKKRLNFGVTAMENTIAKSPPPMRDTALTRELTISDLRRLRQTVPNVAMDVAPWLHGANTDDISVSVVWRADLGEDDKRWVETVDAAPPVMAEAMPCPFYEVRKWLDKRKVVVGDRVVSGESIKPGDLLVVPSAYGGYAVFGWDPESLVAVTDIGNSASAGAKVRLVGADEHTDIKACLKELNIEITDPVSMAYPAGLVVVPANRRVDSHAVMLEDHLKGVAEVAAGLTKEAVVIQAAQLHDIGKKDHRFQVLLGARGEPLAKSGHATPWAAMQARSWSGLPKGWRHEVASVAMLPAEASELLRYLVGTHHGHARAVLPVGGDVELWERAGGRHWGNMTERLNEEHGPWGLAYMEALVRLSDWIQSAKEQERNV